MTGAEVLKLAVVLFVGMLAGYYVYALLRRRP